MICCKIVADFPSGDLGALFKHLGAKGEFLYDDTHNLFFANTEDEKCTKSKVASILRKTGYTDHFITEYTKDREPREEEYIKGWIADKVARIIYTQFERANQEAFHGVMKGLDELDAELAALYSEAQKAAADEATE